MSITLSTLMRLPWHLKQYDEARAVWEEHGRGDHYLTLDEVRRVCADVLPGAKITQHILWRYSMVWAKDSAD